MEDKVINRGLALLTKYKPMLDEYQINTDLRKAHFIATLATESKCLPIRENMNYSAERLVEVFHKYFPTLESAIPYVGNPEMIGNKVYGGRMGNSALEGFLYRGRGYCQITGKANYQALSNYTKIDFVMNPEWLVTDERMAMLSAAWFWLGHKCNNYADADNAKMVRKMVNGGANGLAEFKAYLEAFKIVLKKHE